MKTTALFVEQVIIGLVALAAGTLMVSPALLLDLGRSDLGVIALLAAAAYLIGIVYDRFADTLLQDLERQGRLQFGLRMYYREHPKGDPFPEDLYRQRLLHNEEAADYARYLRTRIRLTRACTTLLPALGVAVGLNTLGARLLPRLLGALLVVAVYAIAFLWKLRPYPPPRERSFWERAHAAYALPRTDDLVNEPVRRRYEEWIGGYNREECRPELPMWRLILRCEPLVWPTLVLALTAGAAAVVGGQILAAIGLTLATLALTALFGWSWLRISETYYQFVRDFGESHRTGPPADLRDEINDEPLEGPESG